MANGPDKPGFFKYKLQHLPKINSLREASSLVNISSTPILDKGSVLFSPSSGAHNEPRSCYNCHMFNQGARTCSILGPSVRVAKFTYGDKPIEYWPVCGMWDYGVPSTIAVYKERPFNDPDDLGFGWVNAPKVGQDHGGSSCGGQNGADECDHYLTEAVDKRAPATGFCRVLQTTVGSMDCCAAWSDDDFIDWQKGQSLLADLDLKQVSRQQPALLLSTQQTKGK